jgi:hypothetical protein
VQCVLEHDELPYYLDNDGGHMTDDAVVFALAQEIVQLAKERDEALTLVQRIDEALRVPAAEYVPAISDVFTMIDYYRSADKSEAKP